MAVEGLNFNNLTVDDKGRVSFSGLGSGIDWQDTVNKIIAARRIPADTLQTRVTANEDKIAALKELRTNLETLQSSLSKLYGAVTFQNSGNIFEAKSTFASASRLDGVSPSATGNLLGATVTNAASTGVHTVEILRTAKAHKVSSDVRNSSVTTALNIATGSTFTVEGVTITVNASDSLVDLRDRINAANKGSSPSGVTASIVSVGTSEHYLLLTKDKTGTAMTLADTSGTALRDLGVLTAGGAVKNQLQAAQTAQFYADGLLDQTNTIYESSLQSGSTAQVGSTGQITFTRDSDGAVLGSVAYNTTDSLATLRDNINAAGMGVTATIVSDGAGVRLELSGATAFSMAESGGGSALDDLGIDNKRRVIERASNTVSDLFTGMTLTLYQAEKGTTIQLEVERDLSQVKTEITNFVAAYNELRSFMNSHRLFDTTTGTKSGDAGVLFSSPALADAMSKLTSILGAGATGTSAAFSALGQIGIKFVPIKSDDPLLAETLQIDEAALDKALLNNPDDVRRLFTFDMTSSDPRVTLLGFDRNTSYSATGYTLNLQPSKGENLSLYSQQLDNAAWSPVRASVVADGMMAPDGTMTADGLVGTSVNNTHVITHTAAYSLTAGQSYVFSTYVKAGDKDHAQLTFGGAAVGGKPARAMFDLTTGTVSSTSTDTATATGVEEATIENAGDGWYRISMKVTATATGNGSMGMYAADPGTATYTGDDSTVNAWFWGAQFRNANTDTTVLTDADVTGTAATVSADVIAAPNGTMTADGLVGDSTANSHLVSNTATISVATGEQYDYVTYVQAGARSEVRLELGGGNFAADAYADFDLAAGTVGGTGAGVDGATITDVGGGWYKVVVSATAQGSGAATMNLYSSDAVDGLNYTGDDSTVDTYFWNQQLVQKEGPGDYLATTGTAITGVAATANIDGAAGGADDGSATVKGNTITVNSGGAQGLKLFFDGFSLPESVQLDFTVGIGAQIYFAVQGLLDTKTGSVNTEIDTMTGQNKVNNDRVTEMLERLEIQRNSLLERFLNMEQALYTGNRILESIRQATEAMFAQK